PVHGSFSPLPAAGRLLRNGSLPLPEVHERIEYARVRQFVKSFRTGPDAFCTGRELARPRSPGSRGPHASWSPEFGGMGSCPIGANHREFAGGRLTSGRPPRAGHDPKPFARGAREA